MTETVKRFVKGTFNSMAHWQVPTQMQKAESHKVLLLPNAEYILVLLSLPFNDSRKVKSTEIQVTYTSAFYSGFTLQTEKKNIATDFNKDYII